MSTKTTPRGIAASLRQLGATAAIVAGIAGFVAVGATPADAATNVSAAQFKLTDAQSAMLSNLVSKVTLPQITLKAKTCKQMDDANVNDDVLLKLGCIVIPDKGEIKGGSIFS